jgi:hypothetical protein
MNKLLIGTITLLTITLTAVILYCCVWQLTERKKQMKLRITDLSNEDNLAQLTYLYTNPDQLISFVIENELDEKKAVKEACDYLLANTKNGGKVRDNPELLVGWYNRQFNTDFTLDQVKQLAAQSPTS